ncbi:palmitoyl-protein thioesterase [Rhodocollybia butyracea]|uniref:Palmitoyl-protein thioesterase 1 n=1 Tax=Rhodocollybia butyracea TaxID=206335 RepID=A0A9P5U9H6_9AGAR|nr:palmitoyl-protein thioesterase [Rhodocollybia butyracea]
MYYAIFLLIFPIILVAGTVPRPIVVWHGMGDSYASPGMVEFVQEVKRVHPGIFVHSVFLHEDLDKDRQAGFYGNVNQQIEFVASQLAAIPELNDGFDGIGFSQGSQFLRSYVERLNSPKVHNLLSFGGQHMGVSDIAVCRPFDLLCQAARRATKQAVYSTWAQNNLVQAQYFRDPANLDTYISANLFLPSINNEDSLNRNESYAKNLASLNTLVLIMFTEDKTVVPKESSWFGSEMVDDAADSLSEQTVLGPASSRYIVPLHLQPLYIEDWIGLKALDERGGLVLDTCEGEHMQIGDCWEEFVRQWTGSST